MWQIYLDMAWVISDSNHNPIKPTVISQKTNLAFDKAKNYLKQLEMLDLIQITPEIKLTERGRDFMYKYGQVQYTINKLEAHFLNQ